MNKYLHSECFLDDVQPQLNIIPFFNYKNFLEEKDVSSEKSLNSNKTYDLTVYEKYLNIKPDKEITYEINLDGHRSDIFKKDHKETHILFSGCSYTFGESLPYKKSWSGYLHKKISEKIKLSGYYNLAYPGGGIDIIINNIYKYCNKYGSPNAIFLFLPEASRKNIWYKDRYYSVMSGDEHFYDLYWGKENATYTIYNQLKNFEYFCNKANIFLRWATWSEKDIDIYSKLNFSNYLNIDKNQIIDSAKNYEESSSKYFMSARDNSHPGLAYSDGLANIFLKEFNENYIC